MGAERAAEFERFLDALDVKTSDGTGM